MNNNGKKPHHHYQPAVFLRKPAGLVRYRHGGYNAVFPLSVIDDTAPQKTYQGGSQLSPLTTPLAPASPCAPPTPIGRHGFGQIIPFVKK